MTTKVLLITSGTTWTAPLDFSGTNSIVCIGSGGNGEANGGAGGGGAYSVVVNATNLISGNVVAIQIAAGNSGSNTFLKDNTSTTIVSAAPGAVGGAGGAAASGIGSPQ